jgi:aminoglycoside 6-adenylyltransferase
MRSENEIIKMILQVAETDKRIRAVLLNGSRANPKSKQDKFQDFDIVFMVNEMESFLNNHSWIGVFGERIILQMPDQMEFVENKSKNASFSYLMLFKDRNRIDLTLFPFNNTEDKSEPDSQVIVLLDKDEQFSNVPAPGDFSYLIKRPTENIFAECCNEFWWVCTYVAKGLWRQEITYAKEMFENPVRKMFLKIIEWHIGISTGFSVSFGKGGKNMQANLSPGLYEKILSTYPDARMGHIWKSLFIMCNLFSDLAKGISTNLNFEYNAEEEYNVTEYLRWVYSLAKEN